MQYPESLVHQLVDKAVARVHSVRLGERVVASLLTLVSDSHWMCWLAGQSEEGRSIAASYLAYDAVLTEAQASGIAAVNLGASVGGGAEFKRHLGATDVCMREWKHETVPAAAVRITHNVVASLSRAVHTRFR
jgi:CelD/BcsL family acetyltransferase involved in cellulose biosynthesis